MTDDDIVEAFCAKHGITIMPGLFRQQHADLARMGREAERKLIVTWLRLQPHSGGAHLAALLETADTQ